MDSSQRAIHPKLTSVLSRYQHYHWRRIPADHSVRAIEPLFVRVKSDFEGLVLDLGCGVGESTARLADLYPNHFVLGVDKSAVRVARSVLHDLPDNARVVRADSFDAVILARKSEILIAAIYLLYPNPWPKPKYLQRRWHGHPIFPSLLDCNCYLEMRTNWEIYADEFATTLRILNQLGVRHEQFEPSEYISPFERKYHRSGHPLYRVSLQKTSTIAMTGGSDQVVDSYTPKLPSQRKRVRISNGSTF